MSARETRVEPRTDTLERFEDADGLVGYRSPRLAALGVPHVFTTRVGPERRELDLGALDVVARARIARAAGLAGAPLVAVTQVHGAAVVELGPEELPAPGTQADALVSARADVLVGVHVADCVPVLVARADGRRVAAVHAGWRGLVAGVLPAALARLGPGPRVAAVGPCLSTARFEVGPEVVAAFARAGLGAAVHERAGEKAHVDLAAAALLQLRADGVADADVSGRCTWEAAGELWSYRRDVTHGSRPRTGRLGAFVAARADAGGLPSPRDDG